jgi:hypothetical protein
MIDSDLIDAMAHVTREGDIDIGRLRNRLTGRLWPLQ